ncbi:sphingoid long-chain base transporter Rsb1p [[Candida] railenensis]|uniref:Sphingoid long-chain base transporter RSB1 n=1 Tax=[Candida] railenensis TaxID=45579 RepID=A0A9P0VXC1_9ASCO|nr:sphingoid long-chain base transporter Rsb1p [[Candida] railenensis]
MQSIPQLSLAFSLSTWAPTKIPTSTSLSYVDPTNFPALTSSIVSATSAIMEQTSIGSLYRLSQVIRGAEASLTIIEAQSILATATSNHTKSLCTQAIFDATLNLKSLELEESPYGTHLSVLANCIFMGLFATLLVLHGGFTVWSKFWYFGCCIILGCGFEFAGYLTRFLAISDDRNTVYFLIQIISITMAPAFTMAGVYYLLGTMVVVYGQSHSMLRPIWYSYIFILCDILSLCIQAIGGALAATSVVIYENPAIGTHIMVAGIAFQVLSMTLFIWFLFDFLFRINFRASGKVEFSLSKLFTLTIFHRGSKAVNLHSRILEPYYDPQYRSIRQRRDFQYLPLLIIVSTTLVYVRCVYRVIELLRGWTGYLYTHELYSIIFDSIMIFLASFLLGIFHPVHFFGRGEKLPLRGVNMTTDQEKGGIQHEENEKAIDVKRMYSFQSSKYSNSDDATTLQSLGNEDSRTTRAASGSAASIRSDDSEFHF